MRPVERNERLRLYIYIYTFTPSYNSYSIQFKFKLIRFSHTYPARYLRIGSHQIDVHGLAEWGGALTLLAPEAHATPTSTGTS